MKCVRICLAVATRNRPEMLRNTLRSMIGLDQIANTTTDILVVENATTRSLDAAVADICANRPEPHATLLHEPLPGIVRARNAALDHALAGQYTHLAFVDDDEIVARDWLVQLYSELKSGKLDLIGGPARAFVKDNPTGWLKSAIWRGYEARVARVEMKARRLKHRQAGHQVMIATNNWMVDLDFCRRTGLRFDMRYNLSGGEDAAFFRTARALGARTGWAPGAVVSEEIPLSRLSVAYQFRRALDQSIVSFHRKFEARPRQKWLIVPLSIFCKALAGSVLLLAVPVTLGGTLVGGLRALGFAAGRLAGLLGFTSRHYDTTTGY